MKRIRINFIVVALGLALLVSGSQAEVLPEKATAPIKELTPLGAEKAGNAEGTIPEWTGGITQPLSGYKLGDHHPDPFANDQPLFTITGKNVDQYSNKLSPGQIAILKKYAGFKMKVYPTRRSAAFPQRIYAAVKVNAGRAKLVDSGNGVKGAIIGIPFPSPQNGQEAIWNHILRYRGDTLQRTSNEAVVSAGGQYYLENKKEALYFIYSHKGMTPERLKNVFLYFKQHFKSPVRRAGQISLTHDTINQVAEGRHSWLYNPGLRRVNRAPFIAYDNPANEARTIDQFDMFNGAIDRYTWELVGKQELYVPYNAYTLHSGDLKYSAIIKPQHIDCDLARYELHRVWKIEAKLKPGSSHVYARRTYYLDEDSWQALIIDHYDGRNQIWRVAEGHVINYYEVPLLWTTLQTNYDLQSRSYGVMGMNNQESEINFRAKLSPADFRPSALRRDAQR